MNIWKGFLYCCNTVLIKRYYLSRRQEEIFTFIFQSSAKSPPFPVKQVAYPGHYQNSNVSFNTSYSTIAPYQDPSPYQNPRMCMVPNIDPRAGVAMNMPMGFVPDPNISSVSHSTSYSTIPHQNPGFLRGNQAQRNPLGVIHSQDPGSSQASNPFIYPSSPSLYINPKDRDNMSEVSGFAKATPKQLVFSNHSTPVQATKTYRPIQHSPVKQATAQSQSSERYVIPEKVGACISRTLKHTCNFL